MKKNIVLFNLTIIMLLCCACTNVNTTSGIQSNDVGVMCESDNVSFSEDALKNDTYMLLSPDDDFVITMSNIDLDKKISKMYLDATTTNDFMQVAIFDLEQWTKELQYAVVAIQKDLSKEEKDNFLLAQESWDKYVSMDMQFDDICKTLHNYNGSMQTYQTLIEKARLYRERTIIVKYMHYLIELDLGKISFDSLTFANQN